MKLTKAVIPVSGGMDSTVILHYAKSFGLEIHALSFNYGQRHFWELGYAQHQCCLAKVASYEVIDLSFFRKIVNTSSLTNSEIAVAKTRDSQGHPQTVNYVPFRNTMMLSIALARAESVGAEVVFHGATQLDTLAGFWDGSPEYLNKINELSSLNRKVQITVDAPLITKTKADIILLGVKLGVDFRMTHTCYDPKTKSHYDDYNSPPTKVDVLACGECTACGGRIKGFIDAGYIDPLPYAKEIKWSDFHCTEIPEPI